MRTPAAGALLLASLPLLTGGAGCAPNFHDAKTPSGQYCSDMPVYYNNQPEPEKPFHRIKPISTPLKSLTAPERLEALRIEACKLGGDAVLNAGDEEAQTPDHTVIMRASGYAIKWINVQPISPRQTIGGAAPAALVGPGPGTASAPAKPPTK